MYGRGGLGMRERRIVIVQVLRLLQVCINFFAYYMYYSQVKNSRIDAIYY